MKYKVGDRPRVKSVEDLDSTKWCIPQGMAVLAGSIVTIASETNEEDKQPYRIIEDGGQFWWCDDMFEPLTLKEQYFRTGYVVEMREGIKYIVLRDGDEVDLAELYGECCHAGWGSFEEYDDNLNFVGEWGDGKYDIVKVYDRVFRWKEDDLKLIWQREEPKEMTIEEIEKLVGSKVKIVGNQEGRE